MESNVFSLYDLGTLIKRVLSLNFQDKIWVKAEIAGCKVVRGIAYLDLIEKELRSIKTGQDLYNKIKHYNKMKEQLISGK